MVAFAVPPSVGARKLEAPVRGEGNGTFVLLSEKTLTFCKSRGCWLLHTTANKTHQSLQLLRIDSGRFGIITTAVTLRGLG